MRTFQLNLCLQAAIAGRHHTTVQKIVTLFNTANKKSDFFLDLYSHMKDFEIKTGTQLQLAFQQIYQLSPDAWSVDLSKRKASLFLEVLKLHNQKKPVVLKGWSDEESEVRSFLHCLPYISGLE